MSKQDDAIKILKKLRFKHPESKEEFYKLASLFVQMHDQSHKAYLALKELHEAKNEISN